MPTGPTDPTALNEQDLRDLVARAVAKPFAPWAAEHPSLAAVIDRTRLVEQVSQRLRESPAYRAAIANSHRARTELDLLGRLAELAGPILRGLLG